MLFKTLRTLFLVFLVPVPTLSVAASPEASTSLIASLPSHLSALYVTYPNLHQPLGEYAESQGFRSPRERLATVLHELVHIDSASRGGYLINGATYDPYNTPSAWPTYRLSQFHESALRSTTPTIQSLTNTPVFRLYVGNTPNNTLANLADELNAYSQTTDWLCRTTSDPRIVNQQTPLTDERANSAQSMRDMLRVVNAYLTTLRVEFPSQYAAFYAQQKPARNLLALTILNAVQSLALCGQSLASPDRAELDAITRRAKEEARR